MARVSPKVWRPRALCVAHLYLSATVYGEVLKLEVDTKKTFKCYNEIRLCDRNLSTNHSRFTWTNLGGLWDHLRRSLQRERESSIWLVHLTSDDFESETWHNNLLYSSQFLTGWDTINIPKSSWVYYIQVWRGSYLRYVGLLMWSLNHLNWENLFLSGVYDEVFT